MSTIFDLTLEELQTALDNTLEERRTLIEQRDSAKTKFTRSRGVIRLTEEDWASLNKRIYECNKMADAYRKRIKAMGIQERERYQIDKNRREYHGY